MAAAFVIGIFTTNPFASPEPDESLRREYFEAFDEILPIKTVALLDRAEVAFQRQLLRRYANRHPMGKP